MATRKRKTFDPSLKLEVVRMIKEQGQSIQNVSESMDIGPTAIRRWLAQYSAEPSGRPGIGKPLTAEQQDPAVGAGTSATPAGCDLLKKASAFFAREMK